MNTYRVTFISHVTTGVTYRQGQTVNVAPGTDHDTVAVQARQAMERRLPETRVGWWHVESIRASY